MRRLSWRLLFPMTLGLLLPRTSHAQFTGIKVGGGIHASYPEVVSVGFKFGAEEERFDGTRNGFAVLVEPGLNGGRVILGRDLGIGVGTWTSGFGILQTWNRPQQTLAGVTYFGGDTRITLNWFTIGIGTMFRIAGGGASNTVFGSLPQAGVSSFLVTGVLGFHIEF